MKELRIVHVPAQVLHTPTDDIADPRDPEIQTLIPRMFDAMHKANGLGLAATQVGLNKSIAVIEVRGTRYVIINPRIVRASSAKILFEEGCLSIPKKVFPIVRAEEVVVRYFDEHGKKCKIKADGLLAIVLQHEIDHLNGIVIATRYAQQDGVRQLFAQ